MFCGKVHVLNYVMNRYTPKNSEQKQIAVVSLTTLQSEETSGMKQW